MRIITTNEIVIQQGGNTNEFYQNADGKAKKPGFFSKESKLERQTERKADKTARVEKRKKRRADRKAKYGARPLKQAAGVFKDHLPFVKKEGSGYVKTNPDGSTAPVDPSNVQKLAGKAGEVLVDKTDAAGKPLLTEVVNGATKAIVSYNPNEVVQAEGANGELGYYKADDTEATPEGGKKEGMSTTTIVLLSVGGLALLGTIIYLVKRNK